MFEWSRRLVPAVGLFLAAAMPVQANEAKITAVIDRARLVKVPDRAQTLVIGNPTIADVTLLPTKHAPGGAPRNNVMVLVPKAFGATNFIALDSNGEPVAESMIEVVAGTDSLIVQRGTERQSYSCAPMCQPTERLGDDDKYLGQVAAQTQAHTQRLMGATAPATPGFASAR